MQRKTIVKKESPISIVKEKELDSGELNFISNKLFDLLKNLMDILVKKPKDALEITALIKSFSLLKKMLGLLYSRKRF